jgi:hypothetical protein
VKTRSLFSIALMATAAACTLGSAGGSVSRSPRPPTSWQTAIRFNLSGYAGDSVRVEFWDGARRRAVTSSDMYDMGAGVSTPWYRIDAPGEMTTTLAVTVRHTMGATTTAAYPITLLRGGFHGVGVMIGTSHQMYWARGFTAGLRSYPLNPAARAVAEDSLWIYYVSRGRRCFDCPS